MLLLTIVGILFILCAWLVVRSVAGLMNAGNPEKTPDYYGPEMSPEAVAEHMEWVEQHIRDYPEGTFAHRYPEIHARVLTDIENTRLAEEYRELDTLYRSGRISKADYEAAIESIVQKLETNGLENQS